MIATVRLKATDIFGVASPARAWQPYLHQIPPEGKWDTWLLLGGRGAGKTRAGAEYVLQHLEELGPRARVGIGCPTIGDARAVCAEGHSGLITIAPGEFRYNRSLLEAWHSKGGYVRFLGSEEPGRWNGPQWTLLWADELGFWEEESWHQAQFGLRLGDWPRTIVTATPKNRKFIRDMIVMPGVVMTRGSMYDNPSLPDSFRQSIEERYGGTRRGRQEIWAEFLDDIEGALWLRSWIDGHRVITPPELQRVVVAIDPAVTQGEESNETGIAVAGRGVDGHYYVLHCLGYKLSPHGWGNKAVDLFDRYEADKIIAEANQGGDMVEATLRNIRPGLPVKVIKASRGKVVRAEPIAALYEQGKVHHVGIYAALENQQCCFPVTNEQDDLAGIQTMGIGMGVIMRGITIMGIVIVSIIIVNIVIVSIIAISMIVMNTIIMNIIRNSGM